MEGNLVVTHGTIYAYSRLKCRCEPCRSAKAGENRKYRESTRGQDRARVDRSQYLREYRARPEVIERQQSYGKDWRERNAHRISAYKRQRHLDKRYGLTIDDYEAKRAAQGGACTICGVIPETLVVDHDHETGVIRDLLCGRCNTALGYLQEQPEIADNAAAYLRRWKA